MDDHTLAKLGFDRVREVLAGHCSCSLGKQLAHRIRPSTNAGEVRRWLVQVREMNAAVELGLGLPPMGGVRDISGHLPQAGTPAGLEADALAQVAETLAATGPVRDWLDSVGDQAPSLRR